MTHPSNKEPKAVLLTLSCKNLRGKSLALLASSPVIVTCVLIKSCSSAFSPNILLSKNFIFNCSYSDIVDTHLKQKLGDIIISSFCLFEIPSVNMCCGNFGNSTLKDTGQHDSPLLTLRQSLIIFLLFPENEHVIKFKHILVQNESSLILYCKCNTSLSEFIAKFNFTKNASSFGLENSFYHGQKVSLSLSRLLKHLKLCSHINIKNSNTFKSNLTKKRKGRWKRDADGKKLDIHLQKHHNVNSRIVRRNTSDALNSSYLLEMLKQEQMKRQL